MIQLSQNGTIVVVLFNFVRLAIKISVSDLNCLSRDRVRRKINGSNPTGNKAESRPFILSVDKNLFWPIALYHTKVNVTYTNTIILWSERLGLTSWYCQLEVTDRRGGYQMCVLAGVKYSKQMLREKRASFGNKLWKQ